MVALELAHLETILLHQIQGIGWDPCTLSRQWAKSLRICRKLDLNFITPVEEIRNMNNSFIPASFMALFVTPRAKRFLSKEQ